MNLKITCLIRAAAIVALAFPLLGCGNKGPLVLAQSPPAAEAEALPVIPPVADVGVPPADGGELPMPPPDDSTEVPPPPASSDGGNG